MKAETLTTIGESIYQEFNQRMTGHSSAWFDLQFLVKFDLQETNRILDRITDLMQIAFDCVALEKEFTSGFFPPDLGCSTDEGDFQEELQNQNFFQSVFRTNQYWAGENFEPKNKNPESEKNITGGQITDFYQPAPTASQQITESEIQNAFHIHRKEKINRASNHESEKKIPDGEITDFYQPAPTASQQITESEIQDPVHIHRKEKINHVSNHEMEAGLVDYGEKKIAVKGLKEFAQCVAPLPHGSDYEGSDLNNFIDSSRSSDSTNQLATPVSKKEITMEAPAILSCQVAGKEGFAVFTNIEAEPQFLAPLSPEAIEVGETQLSIHKSIFPEADKPVSKKVKAPDEHHPKILKRIATHKQPQSLDRKVSADAENSISKIVEYREHAKNFEAENSSSEELEQHLKSEQISEIDVDSILEALAEEIEREYRRFYGR